MVLVGLLSQLKWRDLLKASCWVSDNGPSSSPNLTANQTSDGYEDPLMLMPHNIGNSSCRMSTTSSIEVTYELLVSYEILIYHGVRSRTFRRELIRGPSLVSHACRLSYKCSHPSPRLMETHPSVAGIKYYQRSRRPYATCTCLSSFFESSLV